VVKAVQDYALRVRKQRHLDRHHPVSGHPPVVDEPLVAFAGFRGGGAALGVARDGEVVKT
jgi:hypothetical protein